jgi:hypothetical protein
MDGKKFKTLIFDDFFSNPDQVVEIANHLSFSNSNGRYPGERTEKLETCFPELSNQIIQLCLENHLIDENLSITSYFQKIKDLSFTGKKDSPENFGWIHNDDAEISGVIYLNEDSENYGGTSIFEPINNSHGIDVNEHKTQHYTRGFVDDEEKYINDKLVFQMSFRETISVQNKFNRALIFDSEVWHAAHQFVKGSGSERLTLVFFGHVK